MTRMAVDQVLLRLKTHPGQFLLSTSNYHHFGLATWRCVFCKWICHSPQEVFPSNAQSLTSLSLPLAPEFATEVKDLVLCPPVDRP